MNLMTDAWIPVIRANGDKVLIAPWQIAETENPVMDVDSTRPDFQGALYQFLIGLLQTGFAPEDIDAWQSIWEQGIDGAALRKATASLASAFELHQEGPAFLQDFDLPEGEVKPISALLIESPGGKTLKDNLDFFIKRGQANQLCPGCAATALFTLQTNAPSGGQGHRVGLRGGGPLTTLLLPATDESRLWQKLWLNILDREGFPDSNAVLNATVLPWLGPTRLSDKKDAITTPDNADRLQMYWGMPRRIRLRQTCVDGTCDLCGREADYYFTDYITRNYGVNYEGAWLHPLTPYRFDPKKEKPALSLKGQQGGLLYRHWLGLVLTDPDNGDSSAQIVRYHMNERAPALGNMGGVRLWCFAYDMDNMKARCWYEHTFPVFQLSREQQDNLESWATDLIQAAKHCASGLRKYVKEAWFGAKAEVRGDLSYIDSLFWQRTESEFYRLIRELSALPGQTRQAPPAIYGQWKKTLAGVLFDLFDHLTLEANAQDLDLGRIVVAGNKLRKDFNKSKQMRNLSDRSKSMEEAAP